MEKQIFLTEKIINGKTFAGEHIHADSFDEAEHHAKHIGVNVIGVLQSEHHQDPV